ncbi:MAG: tetratricopeptide repeat protein [Pelagibacteraceae bacterium]|nr:tetratricopeptide repeat protein [Pelagibacteraceae bacterium]
MEIKRLLKKAKMHERKGQIEQAIQNYQTILDAFPKNQEAIKGLKKIRANILQNSSVDSKQDEINTVISLYFQGKIQQSLQSAKALLNIYPNEVMLFNLCGICYSDLGQFNKSIVSYKSALKLQPDCVDVHFNLGNCYKTMGEFELAIVCYKQVLRINSSYDKAYFNLGIIYTDLEQSGLAILNYKEALKINPNYGEVYTNLGDIYKKEGQFNEAVENYRKALKIIPDFTELHYNLGTALCALEKFNEAIKHYELALKIKPDFVESSFDLGIIYNNLHQHEMAIKYFKQVIKYEPNNAETHCNIGKAFLNLDETSKAKIYFEKTLELNPHDAEAHCNLGKLYLDEHLTGKALSYLEKSLEICPGHINIMSNLGAVNEQLGEIDVAFNYYERALTINPEFIEGRFNLSLLQLNNGFISEGFKNYESRWEYEKFPSARRQFSIPRWRGESLQGKNILLWAEQGIGDEIEFASLIPEFKELGCNVGIECAAKLIELFQWSFPWAEVRETGAVNCEESEVYALFDYQIPFGSIAPLFRKTLDDFRRNQKPYIPRLKEGEIKVRNKLNLEDGQLLIGLCWRSTNQSSERSVHFITVEELAPLKAIKNAVFLGVQYDDCMPELDRVRELGLPIRYYTNIDQKNDLSSTSALIGACDLVISASTAVFQISGALGVPVIVFDSSKSRNNPIPWFPTVRYFPLNPDNPSLLMSNIINQIPELISWANEVTTSERQINPY